MHPNLDYSFNTTEKKWQNFWQHNQCFTAQIQSNLPKYYVLEMFPYPSGKLHVGHVRNYTIGDVSARYKMMQGFNVLHPMGWDSFGLPAENAAIANNISPKKWTYENINQMKYQIQALGISYDWSREVITCSPDYYVYEQKFFLDLLKKQLAYKKKSYVNWDPVEQTVLANEQVVQGRGWRSGAVIEKKMLSQWFLKITNYQDELLNDLKKLEEWPTKVKVAQSNWIGESEGILLHLDIVDKNHKKIGTIDTFCCKPELIFGYSFVSIDITHHFTEKFLSNKDKLAVQKQALTNIYDTKFGIKIDYYAINPANNIKLPIYINNLVTDYPQYARLGALDACDADKMFASTHKISCNTVLAKNDLGQTVLINSEFLNGYNVSQAKKKITEYIQNNNLGTKKTIYRIKDWGISRQRFWGCPIPVIYCQKCGMLPVLEKDLPVTLPEEEVYDFKSGNYLQQHPTWKYTKCYKCGSPATRETDTFDTFFESSWYFLRFCSKSNKTMIEKKECDYWMPVDHYIGGMEHAIAHLLYSRFIVKVLRDSNEVINLDEPFKKLSTQGMVLHHTFIDQDNNWVYPDEVIEKDNKFFHKRDNSTVKKGKVEKMSKSKKNVIDVDNILNQYGADATRLFVLSDNPIEYDMQWSNQGIRGTKKFLNNLYALGHNISAKTGKIDKTPNTELEQILTHTITNVTNCLENTKMNKAIALLRILYNKIVETHQLDMDIINISVYKAFKNLVIMFNPFIPHVTEEIWSILGNSNTLVDVSWPKHKSICSPIKQDECTIAIQINSKIRAKLKVKLDLNKDQLMHLAKQDKKIQSIIANQEIKKIVFVPNKVINFVI